ncbi:hypothetical protein MKK69_30805 [Methylobacterium sp. J-026]|uniref:hypothetical protein n=1 Tax=Methylobacterium sp. J-026 TaxID=2836624 RepID=UPI001FBA6D43|nr:hypothetical protein [Methylobacterium sp. J-026]MCJ2138395.1 hypothetical protein [Methylobacterium sp. J-026]
MTSPVMDEAVISALAADIWRLRDELDGPDFYWTVIARLAVYAPNVTAGELFEALRRYEAQVKGDWPAEAAEARLH